MSPKNTRRVLVAKDAAGNVTAIGVPNAKFAKIRLHPPSGGTVEEIEIAARAKQETAPLDQQMVEELTETGRLTIGRTARPKRR
jgi:hypothetical protein